jgi:hypothetical protein
MGFALVRAQWKSWVERHCRRHAQVVVPALALTAVLVAVPLASSVHGSSGLALPAPRYISNNIDDYLALPGDQVVVVPDGTYSAGTVAAPHPATTGAYGGWLVLVAQDQGQVVIDPGFGNQLWLQQATSRVMFVGFAFRAEVVDDASNVVFWYCDHQDPDGGYLQRPGNHVPVMFTAGAGPLQAYGDDFHNGVATPVVLGTGATDVTLQGVRVFGTDTRFDGWSGAPGTDPRSRVESIASSPGGLSNVRVLDSYLEGTYSLWDTVNASDSDLLWQDIWYGFGYTNEFQLGARNGDTIANARRVDWRVFGPDVTGAGDPLVYVGTTAFEGAQAYTQQASVQLTDTNVTDGYPAGVLSPADAQSSPADPANVWRTAHPYDSWPAFFGWPPPAVATTTPMTGPVTPLTPATDIAPFAVVTASGEDSATTQVAAKAVDGSVLGWPVDYTHEWATVGGGAGSWLKLSWGTPVTLDHVVLDDRPNLADQVTSATLTFDDGTTVAVPPLPNDGSPLTVAFPAHATTSLLLTITGVSASTQNIGLAEIEAWTAPAPTTTTTTVVASPTTTTAAPVTTTTGAPPPAPPAPPAPGSPTTLDTLGDVLAFGQPTNPVLPAPESGWPVWTSASNNPLPDPEGRWPYITAWFQAFPDPSAPFPTPGSVLVEVKNVETYVHSISMGAWVRVQASPTVDGYWYTDDWAANTHADWQAQADGGSAAALPAANEFLHGWPNGGRGALPVPDSDIDGEFVTAQARLVGPAAATAQVLFNLGADWWVDATSANTGNTGPTGNNEQVVTGPMVHLTDQWGAYSAWPSAALAQAPGTGSWTAAQMRASSPPLDGMGLP